MEWQADEVGRTDNGTGDKTNDGRDGDRGTGLTERNLLHAHKRSLNE